MYLITMAGFSVFSHKNNLRFEPLSTAGTTTSVMSQVVREQHVPEFTRLEAVQGPLQFDFEGLTSPQA